MSTAIGKRPTQVLTLAAALLVGAVVSLSIGVYAGLHEPANRPLVTLGFSGMLQFKAC